MFSAQPSRFLTVTCFTSLMLCALAAESGASEAIQPKLIAKSERAFARPHDVALSPEGLYLVVADIDNDEIAILDPGRLKVLGRFGKGDLSSPHDVAFDAKGRLLVADTGNNRIVVYRFEGVIRGGGVNAEIVETWTDGIDWPEGVAGGPGGRAYVGNVGSNSLALVESGKVVKRVSTAGKGDLEFERPHDVHVSAAGDVILVDSGNDRIVVFDSDLEFRRELAGPGYGFKEPKYVAVDDEGFLWVADEHNNQIKIYDRGDRLTGVIGTGAKGDGPGELNWPEGVETAGRYIWVSDTHNHRILLYRRK